MRICSLCSLLLLALSGTLLAQPARPVRADADLAAECLAMTALDLPELVAIESDWMPASETSAVAANGRITAVLPAHCRVRARVEPDIRFEVWLPAPESWNGRFLGVGSDGQGGEISVDRLTTALGQGYAAAATDDGHAQGGFDWLADHGLLRDFAYRAVYEMTAKAAVIVTDFYGRPADFRYFNGCSVGGLQGLMQAERFPAGYDGIVAGAPLSPFVAALSTQIWLSTATRATPGRSLLGPDALGLLADAALAKCDSLDGVTDGVLEDPRRCNFDPRRLQCGSAPQGRCLTPDQVDAVVAIYAGPSTNQPRGPLAAPARNPFTGPLNEANAVTAAPARVVDGVPPIDLPGLAIGSESGWRFLTTDEPASLALEFFRRAVYANPVWDWRNFELGIDHAHAEVELGWMLNTDARRLAAFRDGGGKLILYQGWNDAVQPPEATIAYYESAETGLSLEPNLNAIDTAAFARLFMIPGMGHCGGGAGTDIFSGQRAIEDWVERGLAPERVEAERVVGNEVVRTRPLCPYPQTARYRGTGNTDRSGSFVCGN